MANKNYIFYDGEKLMLDEWTTVSNKAKTLPHGEAYVRQLIHRTKKGKTNQPIDFRHLEALGITLVKK